MDGRTAKKSIFTRSIAGRVRIVKRKARASADTRAIPFEMAAPDLPATQAEIATVARFLA